MDLSNIMNNEERKDKHTEQSLRSEPSRPGDRPETEDSYHAQGRAGYLPTLQTPHQNPRLSYQQSAHPKSASPYNESQYGGFQHQYTQSPTSRNPSIVSVSPSMAHMASPATTYQQTAVTPGSRYSSDHRPPSHPSTASSQGHTPFAPPDSPISIRSLSQQHQSFASQQISPQPQIPQLNHRLSLQHSGQELLNLYDPQPQRYSTGPSSSSPHSASKLPSVYHNPTVPRSPNSYENSPGPPHFARTNNSVSGARQDSIGLSPKTKLSTIMEPPPASPAVNPEPGTAQAGLTEASPVQSNMPPEPAVSQAVRQRTNDQTIPLDTVSKFKRPLEDENVAETKQTQPPPKKRKPQEIPIWAQRAKNTKPLKKYHERPHLRSNGSNPSMVASRVNGHSRPAAQPFYDDDGPLGPWEKSITNVEPTEEITKSIADFLFQYVVERDDLAADDGSSQLGQLEIEAKIGRIIDKNTHERVRLPIETEAVLVESSNFEFAFESSMTEKQHANFNHFLNESVKLSRTPPQVTATKKPTKPRIPIKYAHLRESDAFYDLPASEASSFPPPLKPFLKSARTPRVRITTDQESGRVLAKIVKVRIADMHVHSPRTVFDWRISVSFELNWDGDVEPLKAASTGVAQPARNKDRMSYQHLAYRIDLTQVKSQKAVNTPDAVHELEVEIASAAVRQQGNLAKSGSENQYLDLVKVFVDNVRILVRNGGE